MSKHELRTQMTELIGLLGVDLPATTAKALSESITDMALSWVAAPRFRRDQVLAQHEMEIRRKYALPSPEEVDKDVEGDAVESSG